MLDHIQHVSVLDMKDNLLEAHTTSAFQELILLIIPVKPTHFRDDFTTCALCQQQEWTKELLASARGHREPPYRVRSAYAEPQAGGDAVQRDS